jgi:hypothetical protein
MNNLKIDHTTGTLPEMTYNEWISYIINELNK